MLLVDIGNTHFHIFNGSDVEHLSYPSAMAKYHNKVLSYISVREEFANEIFRIENWKNISSQMILEGGYDTMGVDRKALCLSHRDGIFVDAGTAITVDVMENGIYQGGYIFPGIKVMLESYRSISPLLETDLNKTISLEELPTTTKDGISYGIIASIKALIDQHAQKHILYFTGGDGKLLSSFFEEAVYDEMLIFNGMQNVLKDDKRC